MLRKIVLAEAAVAGVIVLGLMLNIVADVVLRVTVGEPLAGTIDLVSNWWMPLLVFLGLAFAQLSGEHIRVTLVSDHLDHRAKKIADSSGLLIGVVVVLVLVWASWNEAVRSFELRETMTGALHLPIWPVKFVMVAGFALLVAEFLRSLVLVIRPEEEVRSGDKDVLL